jgi:hypothetical protein
MQRERKRGGVTAMPPWWTAADAAELDALVYELVRVVFEHRPSCRHGVPCPNVSRGCDVVVDWLEARKRRSRALWLRAQQDAEEAA